MFIHMMEWIKKKVYIILEKEKSLDRWAEHINELLKITERIAM